MPSVTARSLPPSSPILQGSVLTLLIAVRTEEQDTICREGRKEQSDMRESPRVVRKKPQPL